MGKEYSVCGTAKVSIIVTFKDNDKMSLRYQSLEALQELLDKFIIDKPYNEKEGIFISDLEIEKDSLILI